MTIAYNGEIYDTDELRRELVSRGHGFHGRCDTEVVLHGYAEWGPAVLDRLNGMWGFAVWDRDRRQLCVVRDRLGIKPVVFAAFSGGLVFASEIKALLASGKVAPAPHPGGRLVRGGRGLRARPAGGTRRTQSVTDPVVLRIATRPPRRDRGAVRHRGGRALLLVPPARSRQRDGSLRPSPGARFDRLLSGWPPSCRQGGDAGSRRWPGWTPTTVRHSGSCPSSTPGPGSKSSCPSYDEPSTSPSQSST